MVKIKFEFPDTGEGVTEGKFLDWKVEEGEEIEEDQIVGEAETDKAVVEIPSPSDGVVDDLRAKPGDHVEVGEVIMELETGEIENQSEESKAEEEKAESHENSGTPSRNSESILALPKVRKKAEKAEIDLASIKTGERITEKDLEEFIDSKDSKNKSKESDSTSSNSSNVNATPSVRKLARKEGVTISEVEGSGRGGKVTRQDVLTYKDSNKEEYGNDSCQKGKHESKSSQEQHSVDENKRVERVEMSSIKKKTAEKMSESRFTAPHVTHVEKADLTKLKDLRNREKDEVEPHLTYLPFIVRAVVEALKDYPKLNAELDTEKDEIVYKKYYDFNIAVDTENGLMIPKIKRVDNKSILNLASEIGEKAEKAKNRELSPEEMENGTFSITNLGVIGGEEFTPIINYPQTAILGIGKISETAEVIEGEVTPRTTVKLSLSYDHRVVDGATGARFMNNVVENLENPEKMLLKL